MSLIKCKTCGHEVAKNASTCPQCGVKNPGITGKDMLRGVSVLLGFVALFWFFVSGDSPRAKGDPVTTAAAPSAASSGGVPNVEAAPAQSNNELQIKAESLVRFSEPPLVCISTEALVEFYDHLANGEKTKAQAMVIDEQADDRPCFVIAATVPYKVLSIRKNEERPAFDFVELGSKGNQSPNGAWTFLRLAHTAAD